MGLEAVVVWSSDNRALATFPFPSPALLLAVPRIPPVVSGFCVAGWSVLTVCRSRDPCRLHPIRPRPLEPSSRLNPSLVSA
jgi:hypothetical protein